MQASPFTLGSLLQRTTSERADRPRAEDCFALAKQSSGEVSAVHLVLVHCGSFALGLGTLGLGSGSRSRWGIAALSGRAWSLCSNFPSG
jgi:hypothetical protein